MSSSNSYRDAIVVRCCFPQMQLVSAGEDGRCSTQSSEIPPSISTAANEPANPKSPAGPGAFRALPRALSSWTRREVPPPLQRRASETLSRTRCWESCLEAPETKRAVRSLELPTWHLQMTKRRAGIAFRSGPATNWTTKAPATNATTTHSRNSTRWVTGEIQKAWETVPSLAIQNPPNRALGLPSPWPMAAMPSASFTALRPRPRTTSRRATSLDSTLSTEHNTWYRPGEVLFNL